jgi:hypothetical protein
MRRFADNGFQPLTLDAKTIHPMFRAPIARGDTICVTWSGSSSPRVQGLALPVRPPEVPGRVGEAGRIEVNGVASASVHLWMDSAPPVVELRCVEAKPDAELRVSNRWRLEDGREDEWLNSFGMLIERDAGARRDRQSRCAPRARRDPCGTATGGVP